MKTVTSSATLPVGTPLRDRLANVPAPLGGLALGIASLGGAWGIVLPESAGLFQLLTTPVAVCLVVMVLLKYLLHPQLVKTDLEHTVISSVMPTLAMATMVIAANLYSLSPTLGKALWLVAVAAHMTILLAFIWHRSRNFKIDHMVPSWFVPPVGIIVACVTGSAMDASALVDALFVFGAAAYAIKLPLMIYRLVFHSRIPDAASPTFAIMAAPASLTLAGYLTIAEQPDLFVVAFLTPLAILMTCVVWMAFARLLRLPFSPGYAAFTFPMVIGATALLKLNELLAGMGIEYPHTLLSGLALLELGVATVIVAYVGVRYLKHYG